MCRIITEDELYELCEDPKFCVVCMTSSVDVDKHHVCKNCQNENAR